ncbi:hypothetical protein OpiT1DRAFT_03911 [Opitutaceae bacterium TAV1]|nr:hypothetical protein OpiT1DRAFT_03911 [Opitutaceae bacterium TAV1]
MSKQQWLFEDMFPESGPDDARKAGRASAPARPATGLKIVGRTGQKLGKAQRAFNRLVARVEGLRREMAAESARLDAALTFYTGELHPLIRREAEARKALARLMFPFLKKARPPLGKRQKEALRDLVCDQLRSIGEVEGGLADKDLQEIFASVAGQTVEEAKREAFAEAREGMEEFLDDMGVDVDWTGFSADMSPEEAARFQRELYEKMQQAAEAGNGPGRAGNRDARQGAGDRPRRKTKKDLEREERERAMEEARTRSIGSIYKQLARALHPDLERDEERKAEKETLMKELTSAYKAGDLHTLLRLELEWIHREEDHTARLTDEKLAIYNEVLKEQVATLEQEFYSLAAHPRYAVLHRYGVGPGGTRRFDGEEEKARLEGILASLRESVNELHGKNAAKEIRVIIRTQQEFARRERERGRFMAVFDDAHDGWGPDPFGDMDEDDDW